MKYYLETNKYNIEINRVHEDLDFEYFELKYPKDGWIPYDAIDNGWERYRESCEKKQRSQFKEITKEEADKMIKRYSLVNKI